MKAKQLPKESSMNNTNFFHPIPHIGYKCADMSIELATNVFLKIGRIKAAGDYLCLKQHNFLEALL